MNRQRQLGFTLVETVVAFAVLAIGLASVGASFAVAMRTDAQLEAKRDAREFARSRLEAAGVTEELSIGRRTGREGEWRWVQTIRAVRLAVVEPTPANAGRTQAPQQGYWVEVAVEAASGQVARLAALKVRAREWP
jgi:type II secretory pathway pseudopilin PulG